MVQWQVLVRGHLPAYSTWNQYQRNRNRSKQNQSRADTTGAPRNGSTLLGGLLVCGNCGWRMQVGYHAKHKLHDRCQRYVEHAVGTRCIGLPASAQGAGVGCAGINEHPPDEKQIAPMEQNDAASQ